MTQAHFSPVYDKVHGRCVVGQSPLIFHCHHYNTYLQRTIRDDARDIDSVPFLIGAAAESARHQLQAVFAERGVVDVSERKALAAALYRWQGLGVFDLSGLTERGGDVSTAHSHYDLGWTEKFGRATKPVAFFAAGWLVGALEAIYELPVGGLNVAQTASIAAGDAVSSFALREGGATHQVFMGVGVGALRAPALVEEPRTQVDRDGITGAVSGMPLVGDERGVISAFGVYLTRHFANYYCRISFALLRQLLAEFGEAGGEAATPLLIEAGRICAFNTFGGIMLSAEWDALIAPSLRTREDWVYGMLAVVNAFGWGRWQAQSVTRDSARFVLHNDYESVAWQAMYGDAQQPISFLAAGGVDGLMHLLYAGDITARPTLSEDFYQEIFRKPSFRTTFESSQASGDATTTLRVERI
jgi:hypothetical protein